MGAAAYVRDGSLGWLGGAATIAHFRARRGVQGASSANGWRRPWTAAASWPWRPRSRRAAPPNLARLGFTLAYCQAVMTKMAG